MKNVTIVPLLHHINIKCKDVHIYFAITHTKCQKWKILESFVFYSFHLLSAQNVHTHEEQETAAVAVASKKFTKNK